MGKAFDVLIVGAGIVGTACALELARAGLSVGIIERDTIGSGASAAGMGHIVVMDDSPAQLTLTRHSQLLWDELVDQNPARHEYARCGTIWVAADDAEMLEVRRKYELYLTHAIPAEVLDEHQLYELEPHLRPGLAGGLLVPGDSVIYPPRSADWLYQRAHEHGATLLYGNVVRLLADGIQLENDQILQAEQIVIANGVRTIELLPELSIQPRKGHLVITDRYPDLVRHQLVELGYVRNAHATDADTVSFNVQPRPSGQILIGSSRQPGIGTSEVEPHMLSKVLASACAYLPELTHCSCIRTWTGLRAATPDGLPLIGPHPQHPGLWLATGHEGLGITTSLSTAHLLAAQILKRPSDIPTDPYLPARALMEVAHE
ncbi:NAD(P)/FAD-dependent oxidoreductase [Ktedonospora formicarum]|uniref:D-amino acid oxidase n=1 Tax=Ktedonospora formicarum TaxID=2778364 RepID=A0A8J3HXT6_9CHLR|nr:FAD-dependent oxidoreductase [Ktedonospora formicarum]GHO42607.1 D-amino acid oxidase [Ktedonospora formicarum]